MRHKCTSAASPDGEITFTRANRPESETVSAPMAHEIATEALEFDFAASGAVHDRRRKRQFGKVHSVAHARPRMPAVFTGSPPPVPPPPASRPAGLGMASGRGRGT